MRRAAVLILATALVAASSCGGRDRGTSPVLSSCGHSCLGGACVGGACQAFTLVANQDSPWDLAIDDSDVCWIAGGTPAGHFNDGAVLRTSKGDGGAPGMTFASLSRVSKTGGAPTNWTDPRQYVSSMAFDGNRIVYAAARSAGAVADLYRVASDGGIPTQLASNVTVRALVVDDASIYWADGLGVGIGASLPMHTVNIRRQGTERIDADATPRSL